MEAVLKIIEDAENSIDSRVESTQRKLLKELEKILLDNNIKGNLVFTEEASNGLREKIKEAFRKAGWVDAVDSYIQFFNLLQDAMFKEYRVSKFLAQNAENRKNEAIKRLKGGYFIDDVVGVIENSIRQGMLNGIPYLDQQDILQKQFAEKGLFENYTKTWAIDGINQYAGAINDEIRIKYDLTKMTYLGSEIDTSRPFCIHLKSKTYWTENELRKVLGEYCPNGIPSKERITIDRADGKKQEMQKGSGMIEGTIFENLTPLRGGYRCRHIPKWSK